MAVSKDQVLRRMGAIDVISPHVKEFCKGWSDNVKHLKGLLKALEILARLNTPDKFAKEIELDELQGQTRKKRKQAAEEEDDFDDY